MDLHWSRYLLICDIIMWNNEKAVQSVQFLIELIICFEQLRIGHLLDIIELRSHSQSQSIQWAQISF